MLALVLDHLWQSTVLALGLALLALAFRKASAAVRYGLWLSASAKFLIPFAALAMLGRLVGPAIPLPVEARPEAAIIQAAAQPFSQPASPLAAPPEAVIAPAPDMQAPLPQAEAAPPPIRTAPRLNLGLILLAVWTLGSAAMLGAWAQRWERLRRIVRSARRLDWDAPMPVLAAPSLVEPGLVGLWRPVLLVPETLPERLSRREIDALVAHEACHLRRRDNLLAALHMLIEALFWFHPLVWWIGARLIEERERACDEAVVRAGHDRAAYARTLVEICRLYLQSPLDCVAGASGSNLKTRVEAIMNVPLASPLSRASKALLLSAGLTAIATPVMAGLLTTPEGQKAVARAATLASSLSPVLADQASAAPPSGGEPSRSVVLSRAARILATPFAVASADARPTALTQDLAAPSIDAPPRSAVQPVQMASLGGASPEPRAAGPAAPLATISAAELESKTNAFVRDHSPNLAQVTNGVWRWHRLPICIGVDGLTADQDVLVQSRVAEIARSAGVPTVKAGCVSPDVRIQFSADARQAMAREFARQGGAPRVASHYDALLGQEGNSPVEAWYQITGSPATTEDKQSFRQVYIAVDLKRVSGVQPGLVSDYVAMLALSWPRSLDQCSALPSITDLFAACPDKAALQGLTAADTAFLAALYTDYYRDYGIDRQQVSIAQRMAERLAGSPATASAAQTQAAPPPTVADVDATIRAQLKRWEAANAGAGNAAAPRAIQKQNVAAFVQSFSNALLNKDQICIRVEGTQPERAAHVLDRVTADARAAGMSVGRAECETSRPESSRYDVEIRFTADAGRAVHDVLAHRDVADRVENPTGADRPIRAWYTLADDKAADGDWSPWLHVGVLTGMEPVAHDKASVARQQIAVAIVVVDPARTRDMNLDAVSDYVAMLALSQPRDLDKCNALPSVMDFYAGACPGRAGPTGLTIADTAYLKALYEGSRERRATRSPSELVADVTDRLGTFNLAAR